jgi:hypothetical protein
VTRLDARQALAFTSISSGVRGKPSIWRTLPLGEHSLSDQATERPLDAVRRVWRVSMCWTDVFQS